MKRWYPIAITGTALMLLACLCTGLGDHSSRNQTSQDSSAAPSSPHDSPEGVVRALLVEASQGDRRGLYSFTINGVDTYGEWPGDLLYYCDGILIEKSVYQVENFVVEYDSSTEATVSIPGFITVQPYFRVKLRDGNWYVSWGPDFFTIRGLCSQ